MQRGAAFMITKACHILLSWRVEAIASLISIHFYLNKIIGWHHLQVMSLFKQPMINSLLDEYHSKKAKPYCIKMAYLTSKQWLKIKSPIVDSNNCLNELFSFFDSLNREFSPGFCLVDTFPDCFFIHSVN